MSVFNSTKSIDPYVIIRGSSEATGYLSATDPAKYAEIKLGILGIKPYGDKIGEDDTKAGGVYVASRWKRTMFKIVFQPQRVMHSDDVEDYSSYDYLINVINAYKYIWIMECNLRRGHRERDNFWYVPESGTAPPVPAHYLIVPIEPKDESTSENFEEGTDELSFVYALRNITMTDTLTPTA